MSDPVSERDAFRPSPWTIGVFAALGLTMTGLAVVFPMVARDPWWALACVSLPAGGLGLWLSTRVPILKQTRVRLGESGLDLHIPTWAGGWLRHGRPVLIRWDEIRRLTHAERLYFPMLLPFVVDEFGLHTTQGDFIITRNICAEPRRLLSLIAQRAGIPVQEVGRQG